jgi:hypothetical protein
VSATGKEERKKTTTAGVISMDLLEYTYKSMVISAENKKSISSRREIGRRRQ